MASCWTLQVGRSSDISELWLHDKIPAHISQLLSVFGLCRAGPNLKVVSTMSVGFDHLSLDELRKR